MGEDGTLGVWRLDRLARSIRRFIDTVENLENRGIGFRSLTEAIDTTTSGGRPVFHIFGALAKFERNLIRERTRAGLDDARVRGLSAGRPAALDESGIAAARAHLRDIRVLGELVPPCATGPMQSNCAVVTSSSPQKGRVDWPSRIGFLLMTNGVHFS